MNARSKPAIDNKPARGSGTRYLVARTAFFRECTGAFSNEAKRLYSNMNLSKVRGLFAGGSAALKILKSVVG